MGQGQCRSSCTKSNTETQTRKGKPTRLPLPWALRQEIAALLDISDVIMFIRVCREAFTSHRREPMCPSELDLTHRLVPPDLSRWIRVKVLDLSGHSAVATQASGLPPGLEDLRWSGAKDKDLDSYNWLALAAAELRAIHPAPIRISSAQTNGTLEIERAQVPSKWYSATWVRDRAGVGSLQSPSFNLAACSWHITSRSFALHPDFWIDIVCQPRFRCGQVSRKQLRLRLRLKDDQDKPIGGSEGLNFWHENDKKLQTFSIGPQLMELWHKMVLDIVLLS